MVVHGNRTDAHGTSLTSTMSALTGASEGKAEIPDIRNIGFGFMRLFAHWRVGPKLRNRHYLGTPRNLRNIGSNIPT